MATPELSVVAPCYNERDNLRLLVEEVAAALVGQGSWELVLVDDGSTDGSREVMRELVAARSEVRLVALARNVGQSGALAAGFQAARAPVVVTLDGDLQNDPADIPRLLAALRDADVVSGVRVRRRDTWVRKVSSRIANAVRRAVTGDGVTDVGCSLKAYRAEVLVGLPVFNGLHRFLPALVKMNGARIVEVPVHHRPRRFGASKYGIHDRLWRGIHDLIGVRWLQRRWVDLRGTRRED